MNVAVITLKYILLPMNRADAKLHLEESNWPAGIQQYLGCAALVEDIRTEEYPWGFVFVFVPVDSQFSPLRRDCAKVAVSCGDGSITVVGNKGVWGALRHMGIPQSTENLTPIKPGLT